MTSTNNSNTNPPGLMLPTQKSFIQGAGNPRDSAMMSTQNMSDKQARLNAASGGGRRRKFKGGAAIPVPQYQMQYQPQGGPGSNPNDQIKANSSTSMQSSANSVYDNQATNVKPTAKVGGSRRRYKGGSSKYNWGCYSGGGKRRTHRKSRKNHRKKSRRHH